MTRVANLNTSPPFMVILPSLSCALSAPGSVSASWLPTVGMVSRSQPEPSERSTLDSTPPSTSLARRTTAPAPSPNRMQVPRSCQFSTRLMVSEPITSAVCMLPERMAWAAKLTP